MASMPPRSWTSCDTIVRMENLAIINGHSRGTAGGGILNDATLVLDRVAVASNEVS